MDDANTNLPIPDHQPEKGQRLVQRAFKAGLLLALLAFVYFAGYQKGKHGGIFMTATPVSPQDAVFTNTASLDNSIDFSLFWRVWELLKEKYVDRTHLDAKKLFYGSIDGMLAATGDPYTTFFSPEENKSFQEDLSGSFEGIGAEMALKDNILTIVTPLDDSPAKKAGLLPNDKVLKIDGLTTVNLPLEEAVNKIRGPRGTEVSLSIYRAGEDTTHDVVVKRDVIVVKSVRVEMKDNQVAVIRVSRFGDDTTEDFDQAIADTVRQGARSVILDLRSNPGGFLESAVSMAHHFLPNHTVVVQEEDAEGKRKQLFSSGQPELLKIHTVVLIDEGSASASEILAGALQENREDVTLVGKKSFGKGSVQELIPVGKEMSVKITVARWLTPKGNQINTVGIKPDVEVDVTKDDINSNRDPQLDKALEIVGEK